MEAARSKTIEQWFVAIEQGQLVLPRFQRRLAWSDKQVIGLFENILRKPALPIGVLLTLEVSGEEPFKSRPIVSAPTPEGVPQLHLLDGQQRMSALWMALNNSYDNKVFYVDLSANEEDEERDDNADYVTIQKQKTHIRDGKIYPRWTEFTSETSFTDIIPLHVLRPGDEGAKAMKKWVAEMSDGDQDTAFDLMQKASDLRTRIASYPVPFLSLGSEISKSTALDVFINMNTSSTPLKAFDIVVAQVEDAKGDSLHDLVNGLIADNPSLAKFSKPEDLVLSVAALVSGQAPLKKNYLDSRFGEKLSDNWNEIETGFKRGLDHLKDLKVFGDKLVPSDTAIYLLIALWAKAKQGGDEEGNARNLIERAFWRSCLSDRYGKTSATRGYQDFKFLSTKLDKADGLKKCALFNNELYPLPTLEDYMRAGWPSRKDRIPRSIALLSLQNGALDLKDGSKAKPSNVSARHWHHIFPAGYLKKDRTDSFVTRALNCALISGQTNQKFSAKPPEQYLRETADASDLGEKALRKALKSHIIPYKTMMKNDYEKFLKARAKKIMDYVDTLNL